MPLIFLSENNSLSKKVLKSPFSLNAVSLFEVPFKKMRKRAICAFKERLSSTDYLFLSEPSLSSLIPERLSDSESFFYSISVEVLYTALKTKGLFPCRLVIINPKKELVINSLNFFTNIALSGKDALIVSNAVFRETGAALPVTSGCMDNDAVLCTKAYIPEHFSFALGVDLDAGKRTLGQEGLKFYPKGIYSAISSYIKRPLTLKEAAILSEYDKKASFNIAF